MTVDSVPIATREPRVVLIKGEPHRTVDVEGFG